MEYSSAFQVCPNMLTHQNEHIGPGSWFLVVGWHSGVRSLVITSGPDASHGVASSALAAFLGLELKHN